MKIQKFTAVPAEMIPTSCHGHPKYSNRGMAQRNHDPFIRSNCLILHWKKFAVRELSESLEEIFFGIYGKKVRERETEVTTKN